MDILKDILKKWYGIMRDKQKDHELWANRYARRNYWLGIPVIVLTAIVGTSIFATLQKQPEPWIRFSVGLASVLASVLASLQTYFGFSALAERHRVAGVKYDALGREFEVLLAANKALSDEVVAGLRKRMDDLAQEAPISPGSISRRAGAKSEDVFISMSPDIFHHLCGIAILKKYEYHHKYFEREMYWLKDNGFIKTKPPNTDRAFYGGIDGKNLAEMWEPTEFGWTYLKSRIDDIIKDDECKKWFDPNDDKIRENLNIAGVLALGLKVAGEGANRTISAP